MTEEQLPEAVDAILAEYGGATAGAAIQLATALAAARWEISNSAEHQRSELAAMQSQLQSLSLDARRLAELQNTEQKRLQAVIERDRTAYQRAVNSMRAWARRWMGMATSRGSYGWDDDEYRQEFQRAIAEMQTIADRCERNSHSRDLSDSPTTQAVENNTLRPLSEWHEDFGCCLFWKQPVDQPPYAGTPDTSDWPWEPDEDSEIVWLRCPNPTSDRLIDAAIATLPSIHP